MHYIRPDNVLHLNLVQENALEKLWFVPFSASFMSGLQSWRDKRWTFVVTLTLNPIHVTLDNGHPFTTENCKTLENQEYNLLEHHKRFYKVSEVQNGKIR